MAIESPAWWTQRDLHPFLRVPTPECCCIHHGPVHMRVLQNKKNPAFWAEVLFGYRELWRCHTRVADSISEKESSVNQKRQLSLRLLMAGRYRNGGNLFAYRTVYLQKQFASLVISIWIFLIVLAVRGTPKQGVI